VENVGVVEGLEAFDDLDENAPDVFLAEVGLFFLVPRDFLEKVAIIGVFHNDTAQTSVT